MRMPLSDDGREWVAPDQKRYTVLVTRLVDPALSVSIDSKLGHEAPFLEKWRVEFRCGLETRYSVDFAPAVGRRARELSDDEILAAYEQRAEG